MPIELTAAALRQIFPRAPQPIIDAFVSRQHDLSKAKVNHTRQRLSYAFANVEHECDGYAIPGLTENIRYTAERMAQVWPNRFKSAAAVRAKYGTEPGWQRKAFDDIYGGRMGNRPGTSDGSTFIGRAGPQLTGRDGYREVGSRAGLSLEIKPELASLPQHQPAILAGFVDWKKLNAKADVGDFLGYMKVWNGGTNGKADREAKFAGNDPIIARLATVEQIKPIAKALPGAPPTAKPPTEAVDAATEAERKTRTAGVGGAVVGGANEGTKTAVGQSTPLLPSVAAYTLIAVGIAVVILAAILIARKKAVVTANWN